MFQKTALVILLGLLTSGCTLTDTANSFSTQSNQQGSALQTDSANEQMNLLAQNYFDALVAKSPLKATFIGYSQYNNQFDKPSSVESRKAMHQLVDEFQSKLSTIDKDRLSGQSKISYDVMKRDLAFKVKGFQFPSYLIPINQMTGGHNVFASLGSGSSAQPFKTVEDYDNFIGRAEEYIDWLLGVERNMQEGIERSVVLPIALSKKLVPQFKVHVVDSVEKSIFWKPVVQLPTEFTVEEKQRITQIYRNLIKDKLIPAYARMAKFLELEYLPNSRMSVGISELPNGNVWYEYLLEQHTTLKLTADELHKSGLSEVKRIRQEMNWVKKQVNFKGDLQAFFVHLREDEKFYFDSSQDLIWAYEEAKKKIDAKVPLLFDIKPKADYVVKAVEPFRARSAAGASYAAPAPDGSRPGIFYINTHNLKAQPKFLVETLSIHEAAPGHHFQIALQQEIEDLPMFRKFGGYTVFSEGWALYAESLGKELGLFNEPMMWYGRLVDEQLRAMRLVVDTGLHAKGWSREQAIDFMLNNSSMAKSDVVAEVERYIAWPGQAVSYKVGQFKIQELRELALMELGPKFDIKAFHRQILIDGALPMPILEQKIKDWINSQI